MRKMDERHDALSNVSLTVKLISYIGIGNCRIQVTQNVY